MSKIKRALVTGSSRGIGRALAICLSRDGYEVIIHYASNKKKAEETKTIIESLGGNTSLVEGDLCESGAPEHIMEQAGNIDVLVLNASLQIKKHWDEVTEEEFYKQITCNFYASLKMIQLVVPYMQECQWGRIVTIGSVQERKPHPDMLVYSASKAAQTNMVQSLALQLAKDNITVNSVAPGVIYTDRNIEALSDVDYAKKVTDSIPMRFYGEPKDIAGIVSLLCSDEGRYITGQSIYVDGGKSL